MKMVTILFVLISIALLPGLVTSSACTDICDETYTTGSLVTFCSNTNETFTTHVGAIEQFLSNSCYMNCGITIRHAGTCACPNGCYSENGNGICDATLNRCVCNAGRGGNDCSTIKCPSSCSGHGSCVSQASSAGGDYCKCSAGYTGSDCSVAIPDELKSVHPYGTLPYGEISDGNKYYQKDDYGDAHPFFNTSAVATVKVWVSEANLRYLLNATTLYSQDYVDATVFVRNEVVSKYVVGSFRLKGSTTRLNAKKSFNVKFPKKDDTLGFKAFSLKSPSNDRFVTSPMVIELYRAMRAQTYRMSLAELYINDVFYGLELLHEKVDSNWEKSRYNAKDNNMYQCSPYSMTDIGSTEQSAFETYYTTSLNGEPQYAITQEEGNGNWSDFISFVSAVNAPTDVSSAYFTQHVEVPAFARSMALEAITMNSDAYCGTGNNYNWADTATKDAGRPSWNYVAFDFDLAMTPLADYYAWFFGVTGPELQALLDSGVTEMFGMNVRQFVYSPNPYEVVAIPGKPLTASAFKLAAMNESFTYALKTFAQRVIVDNAGVTEARRQAYYQLARPFLARDKMFGLASGTHRNQTGLPLFDTASAETKDYFATRWAYLASMFYANGHGSCDSNGVCTCNANYFGKACDQYCGVEFSQTQTSSWKSGSQSYSQWQVTIKVGSSALYSASIKAAINGASSFSLWNLDKTSGSSDLYSVPSYQYTNGAIPAGSTSITFGYTISSASPATFTLNNNACVPKACNVAVTATKSSQWTSGNVVYQQYTLQFTNNDASAAATATAKLNFYGGAYVSDSWNLSPSTSAAGESSKNFTCNLYNLQKGSTYSGCGFRVTVPAASASSVSSEVSLASAVCL